MSLASKIYGGPLNPYKHLYPYISLFTKENPMSKSQSVTMLYRVNPVFCAKHPNVEKLDSCDTDVPALDPTHLPDHHAETMTKTMFTFKQKVHLIRELERSFSEKITRKFKVIREVHVTPILPRCLEGGVPAVEIDLLINGKRSYYQKNNKGSFWLLASMGAYIQILVSMRDVQAALALQAPHFYLDLRVVGSNFELPLLKSIEETERSSMKPGWRHYRHFISLPSDSEDEEDSSSEKDADDYSEHEFDDETDQDLVERALPLVIADDSDSDVDDEDSPTLRIARNSLVRYINRVPTAVSRPFPKKAPRFPTKMINRIWELDVMACVEYLAADGSRCLRTDIVLDFEFPGVRIIEACQVQITSAEEFEYAEFRIAEDVNEFASKTLLMGTVEDSVLSIQTQLDLPTVTCGVLEIRTPYSEKVMFNTYRIHVTGTGFRTHRDADDDDGPRIVVKNDYVSFVRTNGGRMVGKLPPTGTLEETSKRIGGIGVAFLIETAVLETDPRINANPLLKN